jgi:Fe-S-cluster containining protein
VTLPLRLDPDQRFTCASCARCCKRFEILVTTAEVEAFQHHAVARWFREHAEAEEGAALDPFEPVAGWRGYHRIRKRADGACGFLSAAGRCRIHEELGGHRKPLTCRVFPFSFHPAPGAVIVKTSFGCPTVVANQGEPIAKSARLDEITALRADWFAGHPTLTPTRSYLPGRSISAGSIRILNDNLKTMLDRTGEGGRIDLRANVGRMAHALEDLTRSRVVQLPEADFAEYVRLTVPFAAAAATPPPARPPTRVGRLLQHGFLYAVAATRLGYDNPGDSRLRMRLKAMWLLAHFHHLAPASGGVDLAAIRHRRIDVNAPEIQPVAYHYLRSVIASIGAAERPVLDEVAIAVAFLNAACALSVMTAHAAGRAVDREMFGQALMAAADLAHTDERGLVGRTLGRLAAGVEALYVFAEVPHGGSSRGFYGP